MELTRWHARSCEIPDVFIDLETPRCRACGSSCDWKALLLLAQARSSAGSALISTPSNEPIGSLNLWWPTCVPYATSSRQKTPAGGLSSSMNSLQIEVKEKKEAESRPELGFNPQLSSPPGDETESSALHSKHLFYPVEREVIASSEFRLVCLPEASDTGAPAHVSLEVFPHDDCPEYETVSYTWGGENGDSNLSRSIYIGTFWDVLLQTENCWEMIRFIRPWKGFRMVWIDALCINQANLKERGEQVANMGNIYRNCSRVIVYLGPDIIQLPAGRFAHRKSLNSLESPNTSLHSRDAQLLEAPTNLLELILRRRYFNRLWVIQELILSRQIIIRVGNTDYYADASVWKGLSQNWHWESTGAPWVQHLGEQQIPVKNVYDLLVLTSTSQAADSRDRIFGVMNLLKAEARDASLVPDYSISPANVFTGIFSHCLINLGKKSLLSHAVGLSRPSLPSWMPDGTSQESWELIFSKDIYDHDSVTTRLMSEIKSTHSNPVRIYSVENNSWTFNAAVDRNLGALSISLARFFVLPCRPKLILYDNFYRYYEFKGQGTSIYFITGNYDLEETDIQPNSDELFFLHDRHGPCIYFILRKVDPSKDNKQYKIIATCFSAFLEVADESNQCIDLCKTWWITSSVYERARTMRDKRDEPLEKHNGGIGRYFPGNNLSGTVFHLFQRSQGLEGDNLIAFYKACIFEMISSTYYSESDFDVQIWDEWFLFTFFKPESQLVQTYVYYSCLPSPVTTETQWLDNGEWRPTTAGTPSPRASQHPDNPSALMMRIPLDGIIIAFKNSQRLTKIQSDYERIASVMGIGFEEAVTLVESVQVQGEKSDLAKELLSIGCPRAWKLTDDLKLDGSIIQVQIF